MKIATTMTPMTPRRNTVLTALFAAMMMLLLIFAGIQAHWWPMLLAIALYLFATIWILSLQLRHPESAQLMRMVFVMPSCLMGLMAVLFAIVMKHGPDFLR